MEGSDVMANAEHEPPEPAASGSRCGSELNGWLRSAPCSCSALRSFLFHALNAGALKHHVIMIRGDLRECVRLRTVKGAEPQFACHSDVLVHEPLPRGRVSIAAAGWHVGDDVEHDVRWRGTPETRPLLALFESPTKRDNLAQMLLERAGHCSGKIRRLLSGEGQQSAHDEGKESKLRFHAVAERSCSGRAGRARSACNRCGIPPLPGARWFGDLCFIKRPPVAQRTVSCLE